MENWCSFFPDKLFGVYIGECCKAHDYQYANRVKVRLTRKESDKQLRDLVYDKFAQANKKIIGFIISRLMYYAVRLFAKSFWCK